MKKEAKIGKSKRGLSPIVATVLLVSIAVVLAGIIFFWAYSFIGESVTKDGQAVDQVCKDVDFEAEVSSYLGTKSLLIKNVGDIPIWGVQIKEKNIIGGDLTEVNDFSDTGIKSGETAEVGINTDSSELVVAPVLMGETETERKKYICGEEFSQTISTV